jgi:hypothetical protein
VLRPLLLAPASHRRGGFRRRGAAEGGCVEQRWRRRRWREGERKRGKEARETVADTRARAVWAPGILHGLLLADFGRPGLLGLGPIIFIDPEIYYSVFS